MFSEFLEVKLILLPKNMDIETKKYLQELSDELHKPARRKYETRHVYAARPDAVWGADLADMNTWKDENDGFNNLLLVIDVFTRYAWARPLKGKSAQAVIKAFDDILSEGRKPQKLWTDQGGEFVNRDFAKWRKERDIGIVHTFGAGKSVIAERLVKTVKTAMWRRLTAENSHRWVEILPDLMKTYNNTKHGALKMTPQQASDNPDKAFEVWAKKQAREAKIKVATPKFKVGDKVRVSRVKGTFEKGYDTNWSREWFIVSKVDDSKSPVTYLLRDYFNEPIQGSFYEEELQRVKNPDVWLIERVIKSRGKGKDKQLLVKFLGYPEKFNNWIKASDTAKI